MKFFSVRDDHFLKAELREYAPAFGALLFFSFVITILFLTPSIYMMQLYDRVIQSRNVYTLGSLALVVVFLCLAWVALEHVRTKTLQRIGYALDEKISARVFDALNRQTDKFDAAQRAVVLNDLNILRDFISGDLLTQFIDFIWFPVIVLVAALLHPLLGVATLVIAIIVALLAFASQSLARDDTRRWAVGASQAGEFSRAVMHSAEATRVMGMLPELVSRWRQRQREALGWQQSAGDRASLPTNLLRFIRNMYMPIMMTIGTLLYLNEQVGMGAVFAGSILLQRAVRPVDVIANSWRGLWQVAMSVDRLDAMLREAARRTPRVALPTPTGSLVVSRVVATPRNRDLMVLSDVSFAVEPGNVVAVVGPSGAGKSSLARVLVGAWPALKGSILLDGNELSHWDADQLGRHIGYVPQDVELLPGTLAENIARFEPLGEGVDAKLIEAVKLAAIQDIVGRLPDGLNTRLGPDGHTLSSGQRQRVALARAVYGNPHLVVLDEPNSNLDAAGEQSLGGTIVDLRNRGAIVVLVTHRMNMMSYCDYVLVMNSGTVHAYGTREQVLDRLSGYRPKELTDASRGRAAPDDIAAAE